jgi:group II intron reverse transcriptase/maturase
VKYGSRQSDSPIVPGKPSNKGRAAARTAEKAEGRGLAKGKAREQSRHRTLGRESLNQALARVRQATRQRPGARLTALWHHVYNVGTLREAFYGLNRKAIAGVDGETWLGYEAGLEANLRDLSDRLKRGAYRAPPVVRTYIPKGDGRQRPLGIPTLEDKIVQRATVTVLNAVYEEIFLRFSYGFRPKRSQHNALDALYMALQARKINWVYDADIQGFFDAIDHEWLIKFIEHRIGDKRVIRHLKKWLKAGVLEDDEWRQTDEGTPQGGSISPLLANIYLHYALDIWVQWWRKKYAKGDVIIVRYADDFVCGFQHKQEAQRFHKALGARLKRFGLKLHPTKTRLIEFGRFAAVNRRGQGKGKPKTFDFLGFTHICSQDRNGRFAIRRQTIAQRLRAKLNALYVKLKSRRHWTIPEVGRWLGMVVRGHCQYYGVPGNFALLKAFRQAVVRLWQLTVRRRSQRSRATWSRIYRLADRWIPHVHITHPYPSARLRV